MFGIRIRSDHELRQLKFKAMRFGAWKTVQAIDREIEARKKVALAA